MPMARLRQLFVTRRSLLRTNGRRFEEEIGQLNKGGSDPVGKGDDWAWQVL